jgi:hypothetical protein
MKKITINWVENKIKSILNEKKGITVLLGENQEILHLISNVIYIENDRKYLNKEKLIFLGHNKEADNLLFTSIKKQLLNFENTKSFILNDLNTYIKDNFDVEIITKTLKKFLLLKYALVYTITLRNSLIIINDIEVDLKNELLNKYIEFLLKIQAQYPNRLIINTLDKNVIEIIREVEKKINLKSKITYYTVVKNKKDFTLNKKE